MKITYEHNNTTRFDDLSVGTLFRRTASSGDLFEKICSAGNYNALCINSGCCHTFDPSVDTYVIKGKVILEQE